MSKYRKLPETWQGDWGGVHINSNIHKKAAYNVATIGDDFGNRIFEPREVAILYYLVLTRLDKLADFRKIHQVLLDVASVVYAGDLPIRDKKIAALVSAYAAVGIRVISLHLRIGAARMSVVLAETTLMFLSAG